MTEVREPTFLVLVALAEGPRHGYGLIQGVEKLSNGKTRLRAGTLYATLDRLTSEGLIEPAGEEVVEGRLRRYYRLTESGSAVLETESKQRLAVAKEALRRLRVSDRRRPRLAGGLA
jgi:DNA-binding PadR family transcriptional regulator